MIQGLVNQAKKENLENDDITISAAIFRVTDTLSIDDCEKILIANAKGNEKKIKQINKKVKRVKDNVNPEWFNLAGLQLAVNGIISSKIAREK